MRYLRVRRIALATVLFSISLTAWAQGPASIELPASMVCGTDASGKVNLSGRAEADVLFIQMTSSLPGTISVPESIKVAKGATFGSFDLRCVQATQSVGVTITATANGRSASAFMNVLAPALQSITIQPHTGGTSVQAQATLIGRAPAGGVVVTLSSNSTRATVPQSVTVPAGVTSAPFTISTRDVPEPTTVTILGTGFGISKTADLIIQPPAPSTVKFGAKDGTFVAPRNVIGGLSQQAIKVTLATPSSPQGYSVQLSSNNPAVVPVPASVSFVQGSPEVTFDTTVGTVSQPTIVTITATSGGRSASGLIQALPPSLDSFSVVPFTAVGGQSVQGRVRLNGEAPASGFPVQLSNSNPLAATVPQTFTVPAGSRDVTVPIQAVRVERTETTSVSATSGGVTRSATLNVEPEGPTSVSVNPSSVVGGTASTGQVSRVSGPDTLTVDLASDNPAASVPKSIKIGPLQTSQSFAISTRPVIERTTVSITASAGNVLKGTILTVNPPSITQLTISPGAVTGGQGATGQITISDPAPPGLVVSLSSDSIGIALPTVNSVTMPTGATTASFSISTARPSQSTTARITARTSMGSKTAFLRVDP